MAGHHFGSDNGVRFCCPGVLSVFIRTCVDSVNDPAPPPIVSSLPSRSFVLSEAAFWLRRPPRWLLFGFVPYRERACVEDVADSSGLAALISIVSAFAFAPCGQGRVVREMDIVSIMLVYVILCTIFGWFLTVRCRKKFRLVIRHEF